MPMPLMERKMALEKYLANFFNQTMKPFKLVKKLSFVKVFELMDNVTMPSKMTIQRRILDLAEDKRAKLKSSLQRKSGKVSLIADVWSSKIFRE